MSNVARRSVYQESESTVSSRRRTRGLRWGSSGIATGRLVRPRRRRGSAARSRPAARGRRCAPPRGRRRSPARSGRRRARSRRRRTRPASGVAKSPSTGSVSRAPELQAELAVERVVALDAREADRDEHEIDVEHDLAVRDRDGLPQAGLGEARELDAPRAQALDAARVALERVGLELPFALAALLVRRIGAQQERPLGPGALRIALVRRRRAVRDLDAPRRSPRAARCRGSPRSCRRRPGSRRAGPSRSAREPSRAGRRRAGSAARGTPWRGARRPARRPAA